MAGRYSKQELKDKLQRSALHLVATEGIERLSTRRLSAGCGLSDPYIYQCYSDIPELLADILGHSSIDTTRIYIMSTGAEHRRRMERLGLLAMSAT